jgi:uncharacterized protein (DUF1800 family)
MNAISQIPDAAPWVPYAPGREAPWDLRRVVHLHRRAGFAATWAELRRDLADGPGPSIDRLLAGKSRTQGVPEDFEATADELARTASFDVLRTKAWWFYRMVFGPDPLAERLTLLWHNSFATSNAKVNDTGAMRRQNQLFRERAKAPFGKLLAAALRDPALLYWLDAQTNRKGHPNENLARELMELFTLGIGNYTEADVKEAARALTGWAVPEQAPEQLFVREGIGDARFREDRAQHDDGDKTILGRKGRWKGDDLIKMLLEHPATARRLAGRLCELFMGEGAVDSAGLQALAAGLRAHDLDVGWGVETVLRSRAFFAQDNLGNRVLGPVELLVGSARALEVFDPPPSTLLLADWSARLGQDLFYPPNVGGWSGGRAWVSTRAMIGRANYAAALVGGGLSRAGQPLDVLGLARRHGRAGDLETVLAWYGGLLFGAPPARPWLDRLLAAVGPRASGRRRRTSRQGAKLNHRGTEAQRRHKKRQRKKKTGRRNEPDRVGCHLSLPFALFLSSLCLCGSIWRLGERLFWETSHVDAPRFPPPLVARRPGPDRPRLPPADGPRRRAPARCPGPRRSPARRRQRRH